MSTFRDGVLNYRSGTHITDKQLNVMLCTYYYASHVTSGGVEAHFKHLYDELLPRYIERTGKKHIVFLEQDPIMNTVYVVERLKELNDSTYKPLIKKLISDIHEHTKELP